MKSVLGKPFAGLLLGSTVLLAAIGSAQAATVGECRALIGIDSAVNPPVVAPPPTAWTTVDANGVSFQSKRTVESCSVKVVVTAAKGKPTTTSLTLAGPMTQDECGMYGSLSSIDSKLVQGKIADAYTTAGSTLGKIDSLGSTGQLIDPGYAAIRNAVAGVQACIATVQ